MYKSNCEKLNKIVTENDGTLLNPETLKAQNFIDSYNNAECGAETLYNIYKSFSHKKEDAFLYCKRLKTDLNGFTDYFTGHNTNTFSYAFMFNICDEETSEILKIVLCYVTKSNNYFIEL